MPISSLVLIWTVNPSAGRERLTRDGVRARRAVRLYADAFQVWTSPSAPRGRQHRSRVTYREPRVCGERGSAHWREFAEALVAMLQFHLPSRSHFLASDVHPMCTP